MKSNKDKSKVLHLGWANFPASAHDGDWLAGELLCWEGPESPGAQQATRVSSIPRVMNSVPVCDKSTGSRLREAKGLRILRCFPH